MEPAAAYAMTNDFGAAEEITQEAFAVAYGRARRVSRADLPVDEVAAVLGSRSGR